MVPLGCWDMSLCINWCSSFKHVSSQFNSCLKWCSFVLFVKNVIVFTRNIDCGINVALVPASKQYFFFCPETSAGITETGPSGLKVKQQLTLIQGQKRFLVISKYCIHDLLYFTSNFTTAMTNPLFFLTFTEQKFASQKDHFLGVFETRLLYFHKGSMVTMWSFAKITLVL